MHTCMQQCLATYYLHTSFPCSRGTSHPQATDTHTRTHTLIPCCKDTSSLPTITHTHKHTHTHTHTRTHTQAHARAHTSTHTHTHTHTHSLLYRHIAPLTRTVPWKQRHLPPSLFMGCALHAPVFIMLMLHIGSSRKRAVESMSELRLHIGVRGRLHKHGHAFLSAHICVCVCECV